MCNISPKYRKENNIANETVFDLLRSSYNYSDYEELLVSNIGRTEKIKNCNRNIAVVRKIRQGQTKDESERNSFQTGKFKAATYESIYYRSNQTSIGTSRKPIAIPESVTNENTTFGISSEKNVPAYEVIFPQISRAEIVKEELRGHNYYILSHEDYFPGEQIRRNYDKTSYNASATFGIVTTSDPMNKVIDGVLSPCLGKTNCQINSVQHQFKTHRKGALGKSLQRMCPMTELSHDFTYGKPSIPRNYSARHIMYNRPRSMYQDYLYSTVSYFNGLRRLLWKRKEYLFSDLYRIFESKDSNKTGYLPWNTILFVLNSQGVRVVEEKTKFLCKHFKAINEKDEVDYMRMLEFFSYHIPLPKFGSLETTQPANYKLTTYRELCENLSEDRHNDQRPAGMPTSSIFSICRNEASEVYEVINPSVLSWYGLNCNDFLQPRSKDEIRGIFTKFDFTLKDDSAFDQLWNTALQSCSGNKISIQSFLHALEKPSN